MNRRILLIAGLAASLATLQGCQSGHGQHTGQAALNAQERLNGLKAATEWDMARQQFLSGDLDKALRSVDKSISLNNSVPKSHVLRARILMEQGQLEASRDALQRSLAIDPDHVEGHYYLGVLNERVSDSEEAIARYRRAADLDQSNAQYAIAAAEMLIELGRLDEAQSLLEERRAFFQHNAGVRQTLGHIAMMRGDAARAADLFNEARLLAPEDMTVVEDLARAQAAAGRWREAEFNLSRALQADKGRDRRDLERLRARCLAETGRLPEARALLLRLTAAPGAENDVGVWVELGQVSCVMGDDSGMKRAASRAIALAPDRPEGWLLNAAWQRKAGDLPAALRSADRAASLAPTDPNVWLVRGATLRELGREDEALQSFATALRVEPGNERARAFLASAPTQE